MGTLTQIYRHSLALLTDLYQLTMAYGYWKLGMAEQRGGVSPLASASNPFGGGYSRRLRPARRDRLPRRASASTTTDLAYLATLRGNDGAPLFDAGFLDYLRRAALHLRRRRHPRGHGRLPARAARARHRADPPVPAHRDAAAQPDELPDAASRPRPPRVCLAARGEPVLEFGLRRAQGDRRRRSPPAARRTSAAAPPRRTCWRASSSASPSRAPTPTAG